MTLPTSPGHRGRVVRTRQAELQTSAGWPFVSVSQMVRTNTSAEASIAAPIVVELLPIAVAIVSNDEPSSNDGSYCEEVSSFFPPKSTNGNDWLVWDSHRACCAAVSDCSVVYVLPFGSLVSISSARRSSRDWCRSFCRTSASECCRPAPLSESFLARG